MSIRTAQYEVYDEDEDDSTSGDAAGVVTVTRMRSGGWVVNSAAGRTLTQNGDWVRVSTTDEYAEDYYYPLPSALRLAKKAVAAGVPRTPR